MRTAHFAGVERKALDVSGGIQPAGFTPSVDEYAQAIPSGLRSREAIANSKEIRFLASNALGQRYVEGMNLLSTRKQFDAYLPGIAANMAYDVAHTNLNGEEGLNVVKNMWFIPISLLSGLFFGSISLMVLVISIVEMIRRGRSRLIGVKVVAILSIVIFPLVIVNCVVDSPGYEKSFGNSGTDLQVVSPVMRWAMSAEAILYNLTKPLLKAE